MLSPDRSGAPTVDPRDGDVCLVGSEFHAENSGFVQVLKDCHVPSKHPTIFVKICKTQAEEPVLAIFKDDGEAKGPTISDGKPCQIDFAGHHLARLGSCFGDYLEEGLTNGGDAELHISDDFFGVSASGEVVDSQPDLIV